MNDEPAIVATLLHQVHCSCGFVVTARSAAEVVAALADHVELTNCSLQVN